MSSRLTPCLLFLSRRRWRPGKSCCLAPLPCRSGGSAFGTRRDLDQVTEDASVARTDLLLQSNLNVVAQAIDASVSIKAENSIEKMLVDQLALAHEMAFKIGECSDG